MMPMDSPAEAIEALSPEATHQLLHELRVHQIELEMQNEELRRTQIELDASRTSYFDLYDLAPVGYCTLNEMGLILQANLTAATLLGVTRGALIKQAISSFILKEDQDIYYRLRKQLLEAGGARSCDLRMTHLDGTPFWAHLAATANHAEDGISVFRLVLSDITEGTLMATAMQESEERYRTLVEWSPEPITVQRDEKIIYVNPAAIKLFGAMTAQELIDKDMLELVHPDFHQAMRARMISSSHYGIATRMVEENFLKLDGSIINVEVQSASIIYDGRAAIQVAMRDVTERKRLTQALEEKNTQLEHARFIADKANLAKSDFLSSMSHELRTPLSAILGFAQLIESGSPPPTPNQTRSIDQILRAGWYLLELINEILDLALIESGKLSLSVEPVNLSAVMLECQSLVEAQAQKFSVSVAFPEHTAPAFVLGDCTRVKQVLINLLSNAIKYNKVGGCVVVACQLTPKNTLRISIRDTGAGLSPPEILQLFEPFNRLGRESKAVEGTGIGLVVCKRLVELMGGVIGVESRVGTGSVFWFELPLAAAPQGLSLTPPMELSEAAQAHACEHLHTLLYVEDNPANLMLVEDLVARRPDIHLLSARDGSRGIAIARATLPDMILMDINLPGISGIDALKILALDPATAHIPVVAISANAMPHDIEKGLGAGFFRYLTKPIKVQEFMDTLDLVLKFTHDESARLHQKDTQQ